MIGKGRTPGSEEGDKQVDVEQKHLLSYFFYSLQSIVQTGPAN